MFLGQKVLVFVKQMGWMIKYPNGHTEPAVQSICIIGLHVNIIMCAFWSVSTQHQNAIIKLVAMHRLAFFICGEVHSACDSDLFKINHTYDIRASSKRMMGPLIAIQAGIHRSHGEWSLQLMRWSTQGCLSFVRQCSPAEPFM